MSKRVSYAWASAFFLLGWLFLGIEERQKDSEMVYAFFMKQSPSFQVIYRNYAVCGECDVKPFARLTDWQKEQLVGYCEARFGLDDIRVCYAIFEKKQEIISERLGRARGKQWCPRE
jgi:hypothetical protein